jgi:ABC-type bacteriocin/lantibiotic exporter with double-glycine peptidase domain
MIAVVAACMATAGALAWLQVWIIAKLEQRMAISGAATLMEHVLRLPVDFFTHRYAGDIAQRVASVEGIADLLASKLAPAAVGLVTTSVFAAAMFAIDWRMACVAVALVGVVLILVLRAGRGLVDGTRTLEREIGIAAGTLSSGLSAIEGIKASGRESELFARIASANARVASSVQSLAVRTAVLEAIPELLVALLVSAAVLAFGGWQVMHGHMTIGALLAFQTLLIAALGPVLQVASLGQEIQELRATMARIDDVLRNPVDPLALPAVTGAAGAAPARADAIEFRDVTFGYSESTDPLLRGFSLRVGPGRRVAVVGASGSGKSTVARLACGLYAPWSGEVTVDGRPLGAVPRAERATLIAAVGQSPILFEGSLRENLSLWDPSIPDEWIREAVADAGLAGLADARGGLGMPIAEGGSNLSGGEAQRVEIARALARRPSILVLDEATSALDATTESQIDRALRRRGCACIVVAHRLSTVRDADEIIVLDAGEVVERGSHEELMRLEGAYAAFVRGGGQG